MKPNLNAFLPRKTRIETSQKRKTTYVPKMESARVIIVEISQHQLRVPIELPNILEEFHTSGWLISTLRLEAAQILYDQGLPLESVYSIVGLQTKENNFHLDYLLSLHDQLLSFLPKRIELIPFYCTVNIISSESLDPKLTLEDFDIISKIGEGGFSKVYLVQMKTNGRFYALKQMSKAKFSGDKQRELLLRERNFMVSMDCEQILKLRFAFQTAEYCYLVLAFIPCGELQQLREKASKFTEDQAKFYVVQILLALQELHSKNIIYRDLKFENLLVDYEGYIKLCDFGISKKVENLKKSTLKTICGTPHFMSPEMICQKGYDVRTDYYSLGAVVYVMLTGEVPFKKKELNQLWLEIMKKTPDFSSSVSPEAKDFILRLLDKHPESRLGADSGIAEIFKHEWLQGVDIEKIKRRELPAPILAEPLMKTISRPQEKLDIEKTTRTEKKYKIEVETHIVDSFSIQIEDPNAFSLNSTEKTKGSTSKNIDSQELEEVGVDYDSRFDEHSRGDLHLQPPRPQVSRHTNNLGMKQRK